MDISIVYLHPKVLFGGISVEDFTRSQKFGLNCYEKSSVFPGEMSPQV